MSESIQINHHTNVEIVLFFWKMKTIFSEPQFIKKYLEDDIVIDIL